MNLVGLTAEPACLTGRKTEPQRTQNTQRHRCRTGRRQCVRQL